VNPTLGLKLTFSGHVFLPYGSLFCQLDNSAASSYGSIILELRNQNGEVATVQGRASSGESGQVTYTFSFKDGGTEVGNYTGRFFTRNSVDGSESSFEPTFSLWIVTYGELNSR
jgi:hypothetical protein